MKRNFKIFALLFVVATLFVGCNWAPEGNAWDYKKIDDNQSYYKDPYELSAGKKYSGTGYLSTSPYGSGAGWKFKNNTDSTVSCKFAEKFYHSEHKSSVSVDGTIIKSPKDGFDVPAGATVRIEASTKYYISSGNAKDSFYQFYLACH